MLTIQSRSQTVHIINNSADPSLDSVDIWTDVLGEILPNFKFRQDLFLALPPFTNGLALTIKITRGGQDTSQSVLREKIVIDTAKNYLAIASGVDTTANFAPNPDALSTALAIDSIHKEPISSPPGTVTLTLFQGVTDAPAMDVFVPGLGPVIFGLGYGSFAAVPVPVPAGVYELQLRSAADTSQIFGTFVADLTNFGGKAVVGFASGFLNPAANENGHPLALFGAVADTSDSVVEFPQLPNGVKTIGKNLGVLNLYPNPVQNLLNYKYTLTSATDISVSVFNNAGALIYNRHLGTQMPGKYSESLDVSNFASGIYTVKIGDTKNTSASTFVKK